MGTPRSDGHRRCQGRDSRQLSKRDASHAPNLRVHEVVTAQRPRLTAIAPHLASAWTPGVERCQLADPPTPACCRRGRYYHGVSVSFDKMVRIVVGTAPGPRSGLWRIFTSDDDIYVQHNGMRNEVMTSLHKSGANHHALAPTGTARWKPDGDRYIMKWNEPEEFAPGGKTLLGIVLPTDHLSVPDEEPPLAKREKMKLLDPAPAGEATVLSIVLTSPGTRLTAPKDRPSAPLASWQLPTRGTVWIVATHEPWDDFRKAVLAALPQVRDQLEEGILDTLPAGERNEGRAVLWTAVDGARVAHMVEVGVVYGRH
jgi:hypothetical protein